MSHSQLFALVTLVGVVAGPIWGKIRSEIVALTGAAALLLTGTIRPTEVQSAFASPAIIALASLFVIAYAMELSGLLSLFVRSATRLCASFGGAGLWIVIGAAGTASAFLNNTPIVVLAAPVIRDVATSMGRSPRLFLIPLSYATILGGACTLIGTSTNLLVNDMARNAGQPAFGMFEITPVALVVAATGGLYMIAFGRRLLDSKPLEQPGALPHRAAEATGDELDIFPLDRPFKPVRALAALAVFVMVVVVAALNLAPIAASALAGAVFLILVGVISAEDAYRGLRPEILLLIAGMVVVGLSLEVTGLAELTTNALVDWVKPMGPLSALALLYGATLTLTEILSNAAVAVLLTPVAVALATSLGTNPRPFLVAVMLAASAAFATPFGYQTNVLVFQMGRYRYTDFLKIGVPLNLLTWAIGVTTIPYFFPF